ncbi:glycoside hydrolase family 5 protein, partial [Lutibacter sp.]|uniref:glycoside hydrolase family 5 protein n=1 Tax=Lutibacter sp. TaxID=1925666 RepID=UPI003564A060
MFSKIVKLSVLLTFTFLYIGCGGSDNSEDEEFISSIGALSNKAEIVELEFAYKGSIFSTEIIGSEINITRELPFGASEFSVNSFKVSNGATLEFKVGDVLNLNQAPTAINVTAEDGTTKKEYQITYSFITYESIVEKNGGLKVMGNKIVNKNNQAVSFSGNSFFWSNNGWGGERFYRESVVSWLKLDWETTIVRAAMGVDENGGYLEDPVANKNRLKVIVDAAIKEGMYVIIDWHSHHAENYTDEAVEFFKEMAQLYGDYDNVIYEIYNEPLDVSWSNTIKPYAEKVIAAIREYDSDNLILVGTPTWSQRVDEAAADPITSSSNIAYVLHFYSVYHGDWLRGIANNALNLGVAVFVTEWGPVGYTQDDSETAKWIQWCEDNKISNCSWAVNDKEEEWSIVKTGSNTSGSWKETNLTESGKLERS